MRLRVALTVLLMLAVTSCGLISQPLRSRLGDCPTPAAGTQVLRNDEHSYCLLYPDGYTTENPNPQETVITRGSLLDVENPRVIITVSDASERAASEIADAIVTQVEASLPGWSVKRSTTQIAGEPAIDLDNLPGQDIGRQVVIAHNCQHYSLTFIPAAPANTDLVLQMEQLYSTVMESFRFTR